MRFATILVWRYGRNLFGGNYRHDSKGLAIRLVLLSDEYNITIRATYTVLYGANELCKTLNLYSVTV